MSANVSPEFVVVEVLDRDERVLSRTRVTLNDTKRSFTIGRSVTADVVLDDDYVAALHVEIDVSPNAELRLRDLGTVNGVIVAGKRELHAQNLHLSKAALQLGRTRLRLRTSDEGLAPERHDLPTPMVGERSLGVGVVVAACCFVAMAFYGTWVGAPRDMTGEIVTALGSALVVAGSWIAIWALLGRLLRGEWRWARHAVIFFGLAAAFFAVEAILDLAWFMFSLPQWRSRTTVVTGIAIALALYWHLTNASALHGRRAVAIAALLPALGLGATQWLVARNIDRSVNYIGIDQQIYPPALRLRAAEDVQSFFAKLPALQAAADKKRKTMPKDGALDDAEDDD
jgi:pSer/pThr/pTyr-binding forkhead associated (FHA) protein